MSTGCHDDQLFDRKSGQPWVRLLSKVSALEQSHHITVETLAEAISRKKGGASPKMRLSWRAKCEPANLQLTISGCMPSKVEMFYQV